MKIRCAYDKLVPLEDLKPNPKNRNKHPESQVRHLARIFKAQGIRKPIIVSNRSGLMTIGHGRLLVAQLLKMKTYPVNFQDYDDEAQEYADMVADNAVALQAEIDMAGVNADTGDLGPDFNVDLLGIPGFTVDVSEKGSETDPDIMPVPPRKAKTRLGDLYQLGGHRLLCGDSTRSQDVHALMEKDKATITFTSPPYNLGKNGKLSFHTGKDSRYREDSDDKSQESYLDFLKRFTNLAIENSEIQVINIQLLAGNKIALPEYWHHFRNRLIDMAIWDKEHSQPAMAPRVFNSIFEFIFIFSERDLPTRALHTGPAFRGNQKNIFRLNPAGKKDPLAKDHGAVFPVAFPEHFINLLTNPGESVLDPFGGSGTTMIAAEKTNRQCYMIEKDPIYADVIVERWQRFTGQKAKLINSSVRTRKSK